MESRYLYRGKRIDNGKWVEGYLSYPFCTEKGNESYYFYAKDSLGFFCRCAVDASTVCQCTGLKDKRGKLIWENDIIKNDKGNLYKAFWQDDHYQFSWVCVKSEKLPIGAKWNFDCFRGYEIEIAGNAFDNPELLE